MQALRRARFLARLVLAWFALTLGVAFASPLVKAADFDLVCSASGPLKVVVKGGAGSHTAGHTLDCPLCAGLGAPPPVPHVEVPCAPPLCHGLQTIPAARLASLTRAPLPARGPPAFLRT